MNIDEAKRIVLAKYPWASCSYSSSPNDGFAIWKHSWIGDALSWGITPEQAWFSATERILKENEK